MTFDNVGPVAAIPEIAELNIGSRPSSRKASDRIEDLRAIPWVFSWGQSRMIIPGWYGFGSAVERWLHDEATGGIAKKRTLLKAMGIRRIVECTEGSEALRQIPTVKPDFILTDFSMAPMSEASHGWTWMRRASGVLMAAQPLSGCIEP